MQLLRLRLCLRLCLRLRLRLLPQTTPDSSSSVPSEGQEQYESAEWAPETSDSEGHFAEMQAEMPRTYSLVKEYNFEVL